MEQLEEVQQSLARLATGDMGLVDSVGAMQLAIQVTGVTACTGVKIMLSTYLLQAAISDAFKTPEILRMFALAQPDHLRDRLGVIERFARL